MCFATATEKFATSRSDVGYLDRFDIDPEVEFTQTLNIPLPMKTRRNGTLFFHAILTKKSHGTDWYSALNDPTTSYAGAQITQYQLPAEQAFNLLTDSGNTV